MEVLAFIGKCLLYFLIKVIECVPIGLLVWDLSKSYYKNKWHNDKHIPEWCYRPIPDIAYETEKIKPIEKALGFRLFVWQKMYLISDEFRCYGESTAKALKV